MKNKIKIGINGFGRIGRMVFRASLLNNDIEVVAINDLVEVDYLAYLLKYDSTHPTLKLDIRSENNTLIVNGSRINVSSESDISKINWQESGVEFVVESTGRFLTYESAKKHITSGANKVIISAPSKDNTPMFVFGVNHNKYSADMNVISNASCTTNCLAPILKVIDEKFGVSNGMMSTIHSVTSTQNSIDGMNSKNWRLGRGGFQNIIPSTTGATKALSKILPNMKDKITGMSFRVPVANVSVVDLTLNLNQKTDYNSICDAVKLASENELEGILGFTNEDLVSSDFNYDTRTCIFDAKAGMMLGDNLVKLVCWYDNEFAYSNKIIEMIRHIYKCDTPTIIDNIENKTIKNNLI